MRSDTGRLCRSLPAVGGIKQHRILSSVMAYAVPASPKRSQGAEKSWIKSDNILPDVKVDLMNNEVASLMNNE